MEKNNKGFMMVELLVVAVVVLLIFTVMIVNFVPTKGEYERRLEYNDIDILYANYYMRVLMLRHFSNGTKTRPALNNGYLKIVEDKTCKNNYNYTNSDGVNITCQELVDMFEITDVVITKYNPNKSTSYNGPLKEYINYLDIENVENGSEVYRITTKTTEGYSSSKLYSKVCGEEQIIYGPWKASYSEGDESATKKVKIYKSSSKPTNCDDNPLCYESSGTYIEITYPCDKGCSCSGLSDCKIEDHTLYRTKYVYKMEEQFEAQNFSITPCN